MYLRHRPGPDADEPDQISRVCPLDEQRMTSSRRRINGRHVDAPEGSATTLTVAGLRRANRSSARAGGPRAGLDRDLGTCC